MNEHVFCLFQCIKQDLTHDITHIDIAHFDNNTQLITIVNVMRWAVYIVDL